MLAHIRAGAAHTSRAAHPAEPGTPQYAIDDQPERVDLLEQVWKETIDRLLDGALPGPADMATELGPLVAEGRLAAWSVHADEQALFDQVNLSGALPRLGPPPSSGSGRDVQSSVARCRR